MIKSYRSGMRTVMSKLDSTKHNQSTKKGITHFGLLYHAQLFSNFLRMSTSQPKPAFREIRAVCDDEGIVVYQTFNSEIAMAVVEKQKLNASPLYRIRMT
jgi:hypothetical protein